MFRRRGEDEEIQGEYWRQEGSRDAREFETGKTERTGEGYGGSNWWFPPRRMTINRRSE